MKRSAKLRLILADDHSVLREGLSLIFNSLPDMTVVAQASTGEEAFQLVLGARARLSWFSTFRCPVKAA